MRILVVGGTGFVGGAIARALRDRGHEVTVYHRGSTAAAPGVRDRCSPDAGIPVLRFPADLRPEIVVHAVPVGEADARAAMDAFRSIARRMIAISSGDVYRAYGALLGNEESAPGALVETSPLRQREYPYGRGPIDTRWGPLRDYEKLHVERAVLGDPLLPGTVLRLGKVYGPGDDALTPWLAALRQARAVRIRPQWRWTHVYVEDVGQAVAVVVENDAAAGRVYNVGERVSPTQLGRLELLARVARLPVAFDPEPGTAPDLVLDSTRIREELRFTDTPAEDALAKMVDRG